MLSPLRYPGGKAKLFNFFVETIRKNGLYDCTYSEPYAGGAGLALKLLAHGYVPRIELNDIDPAIAAFWRSILEETDEFCALVTDAQLSVEEWRRQKAIYGQGLEAGELALGFSAYYLNRTSRSGIIEGSGPIGGYLQQSNWTIDARFNKLAQVSQIQQIANFASCIKVFSLDALEFVRTRLQSTQYFLYLDPPYFVKGRKLYKNFYKPGDHQAIADKLVRHRSGQWIVSYDHVPEIVGLYHDLTPLVYSLRYTAGPSCSGEEVIFASDSLSIPSEVYLKNAA